MTPKSLRIVALLAAAALTGSLVYVGTAGAKSEKAPAPKVAPKVAPDKAPGASAMSAKERDIRHLLDITGASTIGKQVMDQMMGQFRQMMPNVPPGFWDEFARSVNPNDLVDLIVPLYDKHFTHEDIKQLVVFWESPVGRRFSKAQPELVQESMAAGQQWGMDLGRRAAERLQLQAPPR